MYTEFLLQALSLIGGLAFFLFRLPLSEKFTKPGLVKGAEVWYNTGISHPGKVAGERKCAVCCTKATGYCAKMEAQSPEGTRKHVAEI